ncbi:MAG: MarR family transcriptional regulator [Christensenellaceae bacterium]|jgi:DNA-binding MarR family transcriptional regulator|nr:MarR family transcriptional regulator [Christensenellaceae bacterium]
MDYEELARNLMQSMLMFGRDKNHKKMTDPLQSEIFVLLYIAKLAKDVTPGEIKDFMHVSSARIATVLNSLEAKDYIERTVNKSDRREIIVRATPLGIAAAEKEANSAVKHIAIILAQLGAEDATQLVRLVGKLSKLKIEIPIICNTDNSIDNIKE